MEYYIYCDESLSKGRLFSHFYGGALVRSYDYDEVKAALEYGQKKDPPTLLTAQVGT